VATGSGKGTDNELVLGIRVDAKGAVQVVDSFSKKVESAGTSASSASKKVDNLSRSGENLGASYFKAGATLFVFNQAISALNPLFSRFERNLSNIAETGIAFERTVQNAATLLGGLGSQATQQFTSNLKELIATLPVNPNELGTAAYQVLSAGITDATQATNLLVRSNQLAKVGLSTLAEAIDVTTSVLNAYAESTLKVNQITETLNATVALGKTTIGQIAPAIGQTLPIAVEMGVQFEELQGIVAGLTAAGLPTATVYGNLRQALSSLQSPTTAMGQAIAQLGFESSEAAIQKLGLLGVMQALRDQTQGNTTLFAEYFSRIQALTVAMAVTGAQSNRFKEIQEQLGDSTGNLTARYLEYETQLDALRQSEANQDFISLLLTFEEMVPAFKRATAGMRDFKKSVNEVLASTPQLNAAIQAINGGVSLIGKNVGSLFEILANLSVIVFLTKDLAKMGTSAKAAGTAVTATTAALGLYGAKAKVVGDATQKTGKAFSSLYSLLTRAIPFVLRFAKIFTLTGVAMIAAEVAMQLFGSSLINLIPKTDGVKNKLLELQEQQQALREEAERMKNLTSGNLGGIAEALLTSTEDVPFTLSDAISQGLIESKAELDALFEEIESRSIGIDLGIREDGTRNTLEDAEAQLKALEREVSNLSLNVRVFGDESGEYALKQRQLGFLRQAVADAQAAQESGEARLADLAKQRITAEAKLQKIYEAQTTKVSTLNTLLGAVKKNFETRIKLAQDEAKARKPIQDALKFELDRLNASDATQERRLKKQREIVREARTQTALDNQVLNVQIEQASKAREIAEQKTLNLDKIKEEGLAVDEVLQALREQGVAGLSNLKIKGKEYGASLLSAGVQKSLLDTSLNDVSAREEIRNELLRQVATEQELLNRRNEGITLLDREQAKLEDMRRAMGQRPQFMETRDQIERDRKIVTDFFSEQLANNQTLQSQTEARLAKSRNELTILEAINAPISKRLQVTDRIIRDTERLDRLQESGLQKQIEVNAAEQKLGASRIFNAKAVEMSGKSQEELNELIRQAGIEEFRNLEIVEGVNGAMLLRNKFNRSSNENQQRAKQIEIEQFMLLLENGELLNQQQKNRVALTDQEVLARQRVVAAVNAQIEAQFASRLKADEAISQQGQSELERMKFELQLMQQQGLSRAKQIAKQNEILRLAKEIDTATERTLRTEIEASRLKERASAANAFDLRVIKQNGLAVKDVLNTSESLTLEQFKRATFINQYNGQLVTGSELLNKQVFSTGLINQNQRDTYNAARETSAVLDEQESALRNRVSLADQEAQARQQILNQARVELDLLGAFSDGIGQTFGDILSGEASVKSIFKNIGDLFKAEFVRGFTETLKAKLDFDKIWVQNMTEDIPQAAAEGAQATADVFIEQLSRVGQAGDGTVMAIEESSAGALDSILSAGEQASVAASDASGEIIAGTAENAAKATEVVKSAGTSLVEVMLNSASAMQNAFANAFDQILAKIPFLQKALSGLEGITGGIISEGTVKDFAIGAGTGAAIAPIIGAQSKQEKLGATLGAGVGKVVGPQIEKAIGKVGSFIGKMATKIGETVGKAVGQLGKLFSPFLPFLGELAGALLGKLLGSLLAPSDSDIARETFAGLFSDVLGVDVSERGFDRPAVALQAPLQSLSESAQDAALALAVLATGAVDVPTKSDRSFQIALSQLSLSFSQNAGLLDKKGKDLVEKLGGGIAPAIDLFVATLEEINARVFKIGGKGFLEPLPLEQQIATGRATALSTNRDEARLQLIEAGVLPDIITGIAQIIALFDDKIPRALADIPEQAVRQAVAAALRNLQAEVDIFDLVTQAQREAARVIRNEEVRAGQTGLLDDEGQVTAASRLFTEIARRLTSTADDRDRFKLTTGEGETRLLGGSAQDFLTFTREFSKLLIVSTNKAGTKLDIEGESQLDAKQLKRLLNQFEITAVEAQRVQQALRQTASSISVRIASEVDVPDGFDRRLDELINEFLNGSIATVEEVVAIINREFQLNLTPEDLGISGDQVLRFLELQQDAFNALAEGLVEASDVILSGGNVDEAVETFGLKLREITTKRFGEGITDAFLRGVDLDNLLGQVFSNFDVRLQALFDAAEDDPDFDFAGGLDQLISDTGADFDNALLRIDALGPAIEKFAEMQERIVLAMTTFTQAASIAEDFIDAIDIFIAGFSDNAELLEAQRAADKLFKDLAEQQERVNEIIAPAIGAVAADPSRELTLPTVFEELSDEDLKRFINEAGELASLVNDAFSAQIKALQIELRAAQQLADVLFDAESALAKVRGFGGDDQDIALREFESERARVANLIRQFQTGTEAERAAAARELVNLGPALLELAEAAGFDPGSSTFEAVRASLETVLEDVISESIAAEARAQQIQEEIRDKQAEAVAKLEEIRLLQQAAKEEAEARAAVQAAKDQEYQQGNGQNNASTADAAQKTLQRLETGINVFQVGAGKAQDDPFSKLFGDNDTSGGTGQGQQSRSSQSRVGLLLDDNRQSQVQFRDPETMRQSSTSSTINVNFGAEIPINIDRSSDDPEEVEMERRLLEMLPRLLRRPIVRRTIKSIFDSELRNS